MKSHIRTFTLLAALMTVAAHATDGDMQVDGAWSRAMPAVARNGAAYLVLHNHGPTHDRLLGAEAPVAARIELHTHIMQGGLAKMTRIEAIDVPAGGMATLEPGGQHLMMMGLTEPLEAGKRFPLTLRFETAGEVTVEVPVREGSGAMGHGKRAHE